jgi:hypothetical protein
MPMSTTSQLTTFSDLYTDLQNRSRKETGITATEIQAKRYINIALFDMHISFHEVFLWAERPEVLITHPSYSTGTIAISQGSAAMTGTSTAWTTNNVHGQANFRPGGKIRIDGTSEVYKLLSVTNDTSATLTSNFISDDETVATYVYFEDEYTLASDFLRPVDQHQFADKGGIDLIGRNEFRRRFATAFTLGTPRAATILDQTTLGTSTPDTPLRKIAFYPYPQTAIMIPYHYGTANLAVSSAGVAQIQLSADADEPIVPLRYRHVIMLHALWHWYRDKDDDQRAAEVANEYITMMQRIAGDTEIGEKHARIVPRMRAYARRAKRPWSPGGGRFDLDNRFDHLDDLP